MKTRLLLLLSVAACTAIGFRLFREPEDDSSAVPKAAPPSSTEANREIQPPPPVDPKAPGRPALQPPDPASLRKVPPHPDAVAIGTDVFTPKQEMEVLTNLLLLYREAIGSMPTGENNAQIMNALRGNNPDRQSWFPLEHPRLSPDGELLDRWDTPYFFHSLSSTQLEFRSAGPDREMFTADDLVSK